MKLIIAEKPSVAAAIAKALGVRGRNDGYIEGNGYIVSWCFGHLIQLADAKEYDPRYERWTAEDLPIIPAKWKHRVLPDKAEQFKQLKVLMNDERVSGLVCATDAGREGELIFRLVYEQAKCKKPFQRLWISSMEDSAIREGFEQLKDGSEYDRLYASAACRSRADWLVGINATRLFTCLYRSPLSVGRVQTPTLAMLVQRERRIAAFAEEKSYSVRLDFGAFTADSESYPKDQAEQILAECSGQAAEVVAAEQKDKTTNAPRLYDLTTLQRDANRLHGLTAQQTLDIAQRLYEKKLITYPRTDSRFITADMEEGACALVEIVRSAYPWGSGLRLQADLSRSVNDAKVGDHHALLPTRQIARGIAMLDGQDAAILELICQRLVLSASPAYLYRSMDASINCAGYVFSAKGKATLQPGWRTIQKQINAGETGEEDEGDITDTSLPPLAVGQKLDAGQASLAEHTTTAPRHYTEDTLLSAMETAGNDELDKSLDTEKKGLGTPATRAGIIEKLIKSGLAERNKKQILPTEKGCKLVDIVPEVMKSPRLTAQWENQLTEIAGGQRQAGDFMQGILQLVDDVMGQRGKPHDRSLFAQANQQASQAGNERELIGKCPRCGADVYETKVNFRCSGAGCGFALWKDARFFTSKQKTLKKTAAKSLLKTGRAKMRGFVSENTGNKYDATVIMEDTGGKYVRYRLEYEARK